MTAEAFYETILGNLDALAGDVQGLVVALHAVVCLMCGAFIYMLFWGRGRK